MRKLLNTLYVTSPNSYLSLDGENIVVLIKQTDEKEGLSEGTEKFRIPFVNVENIVCFGYMGASPALMGKCADNQIPINFLKPNGEFLARIIGETKGSVFLRKKQYHLSDNDEYCLTFTRNLIMSKLFNTRFTLERTIRDSGESCEPLQQVSNFIKDNIQRVNEYNSIEALMGFEGMVAKQYFSVFNHMIIQQKKYFNITDRNKRPPLDAVNCMLSYLYVILGLEIKSALETVGLDPYVGFMHSLRSGRASLAQDLIEELRAYLVDRTVLTLINLKQVNEKDFIIKEGGAVLMTDDGRRKILSAWQEKKKEIIRHPVIDEKIEIGLIPYVQAQLLARHIRGDLEEYPNFLCR